VCPQGIDIREGFQLECIACGRCVDACETVMPKFGQPSLVRYSTQAIDEGRRTRLVRPRTLVYAGLLATLAGAIVVLALTRSPIEASLNRAAGTHFVVDADGFVRNTFILRVANNDAQGDGNQYQVRLDGLDGAEVQVPPIQLDAIESTSVPVVVRMPRDKIGLVQAFTVTVACQEDHVTLQSTFRGPGGALGAAHGG
jgi:polyferredoxin